LDEYAELNPCPEKKTAAHSMDKNKQMKTRWVLGKVPESLG
jgi:hypothetical protein